MVHDLHGIEDQRSEYYAVVEAVVDRVGRKAVAISGGFVPRTTWTGLGGAWAILS